MRTKSLFACAAALGLIAIGLAGCGDDNGTGFTTQTSASNDDEAIGMIIAEDTDSFGFGTEMDESAVQVADLQGKSGADGAPIDSFFFVRLIRNEGVTRDIHIENVPGEPPIANVTVVRDLGGIFRLFYDDPDMVYLPGTLDKPLAATATRSAKFVKRGGPDRHRGWRLLEVSPLEMVSDPITKVLQSVEISSASVSMIITDPSALVPVEELPTFGMGEDVTLTVTTDDETDFVFLHTPRRKWEFQPLGGGVFEGMWTTGDRPGRRHAAIDVIDEDTLFDDEAPYDSVLWGLNYRVAGDGDGAGDVPNGS